MDFTKLSDDELIEMYQKIDDFLKYIEKEETKTTDS